MSAVSSIKARVLVDYEKYKHLLELSEKTHQEELEKNTFHKSSQEEPESEVLKTTEAANSQSSELGSSLNAVKQAEFAHKTLLDNELELKDLLLERQRNDKSLMCDSVEAGLTSKLPVKKRKAPKLDKQFKSKNWYTVL